MTGDLLNRCWLWRTGCTGAPVQFIVRYDVDPIRFMARVEARCRNHKWTFSKRKKPIAAREVTREEAVEWLLLHDVHGS